MSTVFQFKKFFVDQQGCAMKINTDGVLLSASAFAENPRRILDIGTGTGVTALMLAQRFPDAIIDAVEIDLSSSKTAEQNFNNSPFADRLTLFPMAIEDFWQQKQHQLYDLIVSNPPFYLDALTSPQKNKTLAKHAIPDFFENLIKVIPHVLNSEGRFWLILPVKTADLVKNLAQNILFVQKEVAISSFQNDVPHRYLLAFGLKSTETQHTSFIIYKEQTVYSDAYQNLLKDFLTIF